MCSIVDDEIRMCEDWLSEAVWHVPLKNWTAVWADQGASNKSK